MGRPFSVIGFTMFATLFFVCLLGMTAAFVVLAAAALLLIVFACLKNLRKKKAVILSLCVCIVSTVLFLGYHTICVAPAATYRNQELSVSGVVQDYPEMRYGKYYYEVKVDTVNTEPLARKILVRADFGDDIFALPGERIYFSGTSYEPGASSRMNRLHYLSRSIVLGVHCKNLSAVRKAEGTQKSVSYYFARYRKALNTALKENMPSENAALAAAVLTGDKTYIPDDALESISTAGISHIICVSGLHLSIIGFAVITLLGKLRFPRKMKYIFGAVFIIFFMALCGFSASVLRAGLMFLVYILAELLLAEPDSLNSLGFASSIILLNPFAAGNIGFIFSFTATFAIITIGKRAVDYFKLKWDIQQKNRPLKALFSVVEILIISLCVNVFCLPLSILIFQKISLVSIVANVLILPFVSCFLVSAALTAVLGLLPSGISGILLYPCALFCSCLGAYIMRVVEILAHIPHAGVYVSGTIVSGAVALAVVLSFVLRVVKVPALRRVIAVALAVVLPLSLAVQSALEYRRCTVRVHAIGYALCVEVRCANQLIFVGTGGGNYGYSLIKEDVSRSNKGKIDYVFVLSDGASRSENTERILKDYPVAHLVTNSSFRFTENPAGYRFQYRHNTNYQKFVFSSGLCIWFYHTEQTAVCLEYGGKKVLMIDSDTIDVSSLPAQMRSPDYLVVEGESKNMVVNSSIDGIIEIATDLSESPSNKRYALFSTANGKDVQITLQKNRAVIGSVNEWQQ